MNNTITIIKKEFLDIIRDRKTLVMTFLVPIVIMPLIFSFIFSSVDDINTPSQENQYRICLETDSQTIIDMFKNINEFELVDSKNPENDAYQGDILIYIKVQNQFEQILLNNQTPQIDLYYDTTNQKALTASQMIETVFHNYQTNYVAHLLEQNHLPSQSLTPFHYQTHAKDDNVDSLSIMILGMLVPMMVIGYCGTGIAPIATDLGAGEKERGTLEPLLSTSVSRSSILIAKLIVTATFGIITSVFSGIGLILAIQFGMSSAQLQIDLSMTSILLILLLAVLYSIFLSAIMLLVSTYSRSIKEAGTYLTPVSLIPMILSILTMYSDTNQVSTIMMNIPIYNVVTCIKEIIINQMNMTHLLMTIIWSFVYVAIALFLAKKIYDNENVIFRS